MKHIMIFFSLALILSIWTGTMTSAQSHHTDDIVGTWLNEEGTGQVEIFKVGGTYYGKIVWLKVTLDSITGKPRTDKENPDPAERNKPLLGLVNLKGFVFDGKNEWKDGSIYDPKNGKTYNCYMKFDTPERLKIRGYIGVSLLGRTTYWTPVKK